MARQFNGSTDFLYRLSAVVAGPPFTMACWFRPGDDAANYTLMSLGGSANDHYHRLLAGGSTAGDEIYAGSADDSGEGLAVTTAGYGAGGWHHACGVWASTAARHAYLDGGSSGSNSATRAPASLDRTGLGVLAASTTTEYLVGRLAEAAIWSAALYADEVRALARGVSPRLLRPGALAAYWPLWGTHAPEIDMRGGEGLTLAGSPARADHAPVIPASRRWWGGLPADPPAEAGVGMAVVPRAAHLARLRRS